MIKDDAIQKFYSLEPLKYGYLEGLKLDRKVGQEGCSDYQLELILTSLEVGNDRLILLFEGVRDIRINRLEGLFRLALDISSIRDYQLEDISYEVIEREYDTFRFVCRSFEATIL